MHASKVFRQLRWLLMLTLASLSGCGGCKRDNDKLTREELEKRAKEQKESLEMGTLLTLPIDSQTKIATVKPGHWFESQQQFKSNREDMQVVAVGDLERSNAPVPLPGTNMINEYSRRTSLPKGQTKTVDLQFFIPDTGTKNDDPFATPPRLMLRTQLRSWPLMTPILQTPSVQGANELGRSEFQLVVLSPQALSYEFLTVLDAVYWRGDDLLDAPRTRSYQVSLLKPQDGKYALPHSMLTMTAIAVLVWDDVSIDELTTDQQEAVIDWLHWGGQLIISGPSSWSRLQNSFMSPYLPATSADAAEFNTDSFKEISDNWKVVDVNSRELTPLDILGPPVGGLKFKLADGGQWLPKTGEMVAERTVGRGRVVVTAFPLREPRLTRWKYFSSFLSTGLLRRSPRMITTSNDGMKIQNWAPPPYTGATKDPRMHSNFRILSRDLPVSDNNLVQDISSKPTTINPNNTPPIYSTSANGIRANPSMANSAEAIQNTPSSIAAPQTELGMNASKKTDVNDTEAMRWGGNGGAWNDYSGLAYQSQAALRKAAGIKLPDRWTIIYLVGGYLLFLVPVNWVVFRLLGRLEYAWIAAPILALVGVVVVTRVARLDIGFARRTTEISLLELQGEHPRGHLTRYIALYTSLSTNYTVEFPESGSVVLPLGDVSRVLRRAGSSVRNLRTNYGSSAGVQLEPLTVYSNSTEMLHAEQMVPLKGGISLESSAESSQLKLMNATELALKSALVFRNVDGEVSYAWLSDVEPKSLKNLDFKLAEADLWKHWDAHQETASASVVEGQTGALDTLWIGGILKDLVLRTPLMPGQSRLFAYTDDRPGELTITPSEDQFDGRCVVVAHLSSHQLGPVTPDRSIWSNRTEGPPPVDADTTDPGL